MVDFGPTVDFNVLSCVSVISYLPRSCVSPLSPFSPSLPSLPHMYLQQRSATFGLYGDGANIRPTLGPSLRMVSSLFSVLEFVLTCHSPPHIWERDAVIVPSPLPSSPHPCPCPCHPSRSHSFCPTRRPTRRPTCCPTRRPTRRPSCFRHPSRSRLPLLLLLQVPPALNLLSFRFGM